MESFGEFGGEAEPRGPAHGAEESRCMSAAKHPSTAPTVTNVTTKKKGKWKERENKQEGNSISVMTVGFVRNLNAQRRIKNMLNTIQNEKSGQKKVQQGEKSKLKKKPTVIPFN